MQLAEVPDEIGGVDVGREVVVLGRESDAGAHVDPGGRRVVPEHRQLAGIAGAEAEHERDERRLPRAVRAEQPGDAVADVDVEAVDGERRAVALRHATGADDRARSAATSLISWLDVRDAISGIFAFARRTSGQRGRSEPDAAAGPNAPPTTHAPTKGDRLQCASPESITAALAAFAVSGLLVAGALAASSKGGTDHQMSGMTMTKAAPMTAADLRVALDNLFGEHAVLAMNATNAGITGSKSFPAAAKTLDNNSVALSKAIASVYGAKAGQTFLNGKYMWRDHIKFFVNYTVAKSKKDMAGQNKAVNDLKRYTVVFGNFLAGATGLPKLAVQNDLLGHVLELKGQLDDYAAGNYTKAAKHYHAAYNHMFMTGDLVAGAIAKQKNLK